MSYKKIYGMAVGAVLGCLLALPVSAAAREAGKACSLRIVLGGLQTENASPGGVEFRLWKVGTVDENGIPVIDEEYGKTEYPRSSEEQGKTAGAIAAGLTGEADRTGKTDARGEVIFGELEQGVYLVQAAEKNPYGVMDPYLIHLPYWDELAGAGGDWVYAAKSEPKASPYPPKKPEKPNKPGKPSGQEGTSEKHASTAQTGDDRTSIGIYLFLLAGSAAGGAFLLRKKERQESTYEEE